MLSPGFHVFLFIINACFVAIGWYVLIGNTKILANRSESNQLTHALISELNQAEVGAIEQWSGADDAIPAIIWQSQCAAHRTRLNDLFTEMSQLNEKLKESEFRDYIMKIRKAMTLDIEQAEQFTLRQRSSKVKDVAVACSNLRKYILAAQSSLR